jgi:type III restriction enzyme
MRDWREKIDAFLKFNERAILKDAGKASMEVAKALALEEYQKFNRHRLVEEAAKGEEEFEKVARQLERKDRSKKKMNGPHVNTISNRLSLRPPQRISLEILARVCDIIPLEKNADLDQALQVIQSEFPSVSDFERDFPSLCFALATGVGKTRLMGAFITYLFKTRGIRHFFVLAPNLTIYNKLTTDFTPNTPKYVFQGIAEFAVTPPKIITGDNYETGRGIRQKDYLPGIEWETPIHINIFNISKITSTETPKGAVKSNIPRFRRLHEYIGQSYFEYLSNLDDLVLLMDESHRYRASAGMKAISELKPILGLELTATPQIEEEKGHSQKYQAV